MNWFQRRYLAYREIVNWFFLRKVIKRNRDTELWKKFGLRSGYINQIYTVLSLRKEDMGEEEMVQRMKVMEKIEPMNKYLESLDLSEIIYPEIVKLPETDSWLIVYWPLRNHLSFWRIFFHIILGIVSYKLWVYFNVTALITSF